jgi:putative flippase GtrA
MPHVTEKLRAALASRLRTRFGKQFVKFAMVAVASLATSQIVLAVLLGPLNLTGGISGFLAAAAGAGVSYVLSRKAWDRKGRPNVLRETIPFWLVSVGAWVVLALATKLGIRIAHGLGATGADKQAIVGTVYFLANCVTFMTRFLIFHYVLFADSAVGGRGGSVGPIEAETLTPVRVPAVPAESEDE